MSTVSPSSLARPSHVLARHIFVALATTTIVGQHEANLWLSVVGSAPGPSDYNNNNKRQKQRQRLSSDTTARRVHGARANIPSWLSRNRTGQAEPVVGENGRKSLHPSRHHNDAVGNSESGNRSSGCLFGCVCVCVCDARFATPKVRRISVTRVDHFAGPA